MVRGFGSLPVTTFFGSYFVSAKKLLHGVADVHDSHQLDHEGKSIDDEQEKNNLG